MPRTESAQLNIRSRFAKERVGQLARQTGLSATRVVEEALRAFDPDARPPAPHGLVWKDGFLVKPASGPTITLEEANAAEEAARNERLDDIS